jgi:YfiH family protein
VSHRGAELGAGIRYLITDRHGGQSKAPYESLNLGPAVGDDPASVTANRKLLAAGCGLAPPGIAWMRQVHGTDVRYADASWPGLEPEPCDAVFTDVPGLALAVLVADCVPVLIADPQARLAGAAHAGREGMVAGVVPALLQAMTAAGARPDRMLAMIGPAICGGCYEVPEPMRDRVAALVPAAGCRTRAGTPGLDIAAGVRAQLAAAGVAAIGHDARCTSESGELFSYRRDGTTGRFAGLIWLAGCRPGWPASGDGRRAGSPPLQAPRPAAPQAGRASVTAAQDTRFLIHQKQNPARTAARATKIAVSYHWNSQKRLAG